MHNQKVSQNFKMGVRFMCVCVVCFGTSLPFWKTDAQSVLSAVTKFSVYVKNVKKYIK
jgi:hypothetical protein